MPYLEDDYFLFPLPLDNDISEVIKQKLKDYLEKFNIPNFFKDPDLNDHSIKDFLNNIEGRVIHYLNPKNIQCTVKELNMVDRTPNSRINQIYCYGICEIIYNEADLKEPLKKLMSFDFLCEAQLQWYSGATLILSDISQQLYSYSATIEEFIEFTKEEFISQIIKNIYVTRRPDCPFDVLSHLHWYKNLVDLKVKGQDFLNLIDYFADFDFQTLAQDYGCFGDQDVVSMTDKNPKIRKAACHKVNYYKFFLNQYFKNLSVELKKDLNQPVNSKLLRSLQS